MSERPAVGTPSSFERVGDAAEPGCGAAGALGRAADRTQEHLGRVVVARGEHARDDRVEAGRRHLRDRARVARRDAAPGRAGRGDAPVAQEPVEGARGEQRGVGGRGPGARETAVDGERAERADVEAFARARVMAGTGRCRAWSRRRRSHLRWRGSPPRRSRPRARRARWSPMSRCPGSTRGARFRSASTARGRRRRRGRGHRGARRPRARRWRKRSW